MTRIVGFSGFPHHGKSTASDYFVDHCGYYRVSFAKPLKQMLLQLNGVTPAHVYGDKKNEPIPELGGVTARHAMETLGTGWGRNSIHPDLWLMQAKSTIQQCIDIGQNVVIEDVRFHNEVDMIHSLGGIVIRILRPKGPPPDMALPANQFIIYLAIDGTIYNDFIDTDDCSWKSHFYSSVGFAVDRLLTSKGK